MYQGTTQTRSIMKQTLPSGTPELVLANATGARLSPDGARLLYADFGPQTALYSMKLDGTDVVKVASHPGTSAVWSPDGSKIAYLWGQSPCSNIEVVAANGSQTDAAVIVRDCG